MEVTSAQSAPALPEITGIAYRATLNFFAIILLIAAGLKSQAILSQPNSITAAAIGWTEIAIEWLLAYWLLTGFSAILAHRITITILTIFIAVAAWRLFHGQSDCGCFGNVHIHPQVTLSLDASQVVVIR